MSSQNQEIHDDLNDMQNLTDLQEAEFKQQQEEEEIKAAQGGYQDIMKRSRENSIDSARSRSRSTNERKRNYSKQLGESKIDDSPSNEDLSGVQRNNRFSEQSEGQQKQSENDINKNNISGLDYTKINFNQSLQQLQDMVNKVEVPQIKLDSQSGYRHARRLYIGNIPETINQEYLSEWLYRSLEAAGGLQQTLPSENPIVKCEIDPKGRFAFTELRSIEETTALLQLDGIILWHRQLRIRRPTEYEKFPQVQGQFEQIPKLNFDLFKTVGIVIIPTVVDDGHNKIFLANLPTKMDELMILDELKLRDMGEIKAFHLVKDNQTNQSKGYAFFEFKDPSLTDRCIETLHGMQYAGRTLTCKRSQVGGQGNKQGQGGSRQQNNNRNSQQNGMGGNNMQRSNFTGENMMDSSMGMMSQGGNEGSGFFPNYQGNQQGSGNGNTHQNSNKGMNQNYQNNNNNNNKRRNFGNQSNYNGNNNQNNNNNGTGGNQGGNNSNNGGNNRRYQNNNNNQGHNQSGQFSGNNKFNKGHMNNNNGMGGNKKQNQWNNQMAGQDHQSGIGMDGYYDSGNSMNQQYEVNQAYNQYSTQAPHYMMHDQTNHYQ